jgi:hypothetical protein
MRHARPLVTFVYIFYYYVVDCFSSSVFQASTLFISVSFSSSLSCFISKAINKSVTRLTADSRHGKRFVKKETFQSAALLMLSLPKHHTCFSLKGLLFLWLIAISCILAAKINDTLECWLKCALVKPFSFVNNNRHQSECKHGTRDEWGVW